jgi:small subunit ribosomal protein S4e
MRASKDTGAVSRKKVKWLLAPAPGKHTKQESVSAGVLLRDVLGRAGTLHEVKKILNSGGLLVDGRKVNDPKRAIGLMDVVSEPAEKKAYRMSLSGPSLVPREVKDAAAASKYLKAVGKSTVKGGKISIAFHDGRNYLGDKHISPGDTCVFSLPDFKLTSHIKLAPGVQCIVVKGKHKGESAKLEKIIERPGSHDAEALLSGPKGEFITVVKYLFAVDGNY